MDIIKNYLDNIFGAIPQTEQVLCLKADLLADMEAKYLSLKEGGHSESEAVARVIGEFGNIDELLGEMGIARPDASDVREISTELAHDFIGRAHRTAHQIGLSVMVIILSVAAMIGWYGRLEIVHPNGAPPAQALAPVIFLLVMVAICVAVMIRSSALTGDFGYIDDGDFVIAHDAKHILERERSDAHRQSTTGIGAGVVLCILAPAFLIAITAVREEYALYGVCLLLTLVAAAVYLFIRIGGGSEPYNKLLMLEEYRPERREAERKKEALLGLLWMVAVAVFLVWGLVFDGFRISWVVFPVAGVLSGAISAFMSGS